MAERMSTELYRCSISDDVKTKDLSFKALEDKLTVIKPKELDEDEIKVVGYVDVKQEDYDGNQEYFIYLGNGNDKKPFDVYRKSKLLTGLLKGRWYQGSRLEMRTRTQIITFCLVNQLND